MLDTLLREISEESDDFFLKRSRGILPHLPQPLQEMAERVLKGVEIKPKVFPTWIIYIPVGHWFTADVRAEKSLKEDMDSIFQSTLTPEDVIVCGETSLEFTEPGIKEGKLKAMQTLLDLQILPESAKSSFESLSAMQSGFEKSLLELEGYTIIGADSLDGAIVTTALDMKPDIIQDDEGGAYSNEIKFRIATEGRTRYALNRACQSIKPNQRMIFIQGLLHKDAVEGWCNRNSVSLKTTIPHTIKKKQKI